MGHLWLPCGPYTGNLLHCMLKKIVSHKTQSSIAVTTAFPVVVTLQVLKLIVPLCLMCLSLCTLVLMLWQVSQVLARDSCYVSCALGVCARLDVARLCLNPSCKLVAARIRSRCSDVFERPVTTCGMGHRDTWATQHGQRDRHAA